MGADPTKQPEDVAAVPSDGDVESGSSPVPVTWFRSVFFQATVTGICAFVAPGLYNAMQSTGAGGQQTPYLVMAANALLGAMMVITCALGSVFANKLGLKNALIFGTSGYAVYSASLYTNNRFGTEWFVYLGAAICGITAGVFWAAEGAIMISYPEEGQRGRYLAYWLAFRNGGSIVGGAINLAFNASGTTTGKLDWRTYIVFVALQCLGPFLGLFLSPPHKVQRRDGKPVQTPEQVPTLVEIKEVGKIMIRKNFLLVFPFYFAVIFPNPYASSFLSLYFSVRSRALASLIAALAQIAMNFVLGNFLDWKRFTLNQRARFAYIGMMALFGGTWIWASVIQKEYGANPPKLDWADKEFGRGWALYILLSVNFAIAYNYGYWVAGFIAETPAEIVRYTSTIRAVEAAGGAVASGISSTHAPLIASVGVNFGLWALALVPTYLAIRQIGVKLTDKHANDDSDGVVATKTDL